MSSINDATASPLSDALSMKNYPTEFYQISTCQYTSQRIDEFTKKITKRLGQDKLDQLISILEETYEIAREEINKMEEEK